MLPLKPLMIIYLISQETKHILLQIKPTNVNPVFTHPTVQSSLNTLLLRSVTVTLPHPDGSVPLSSFVTLSVPTIKQNSFLMWPIWASAASHSSDYCHWKASQLTGGLNTPQITPEGHFIRRTTFPQQVPHVLMYLFSSLTCIRV